MMDKNLPIKMLYFTRCTKIAGTAFLELFKGRDYPLNYFVCFATKTWEKMFITWSTLSRHLGKKLESTTEREIENK